MSDLKPVPISRGRQELIAGDEWLRSIEPPVYSCEPILMAEQLNSLTAPTNHGKSAISSFLVAGYLKGGRLGPFEFKRAKVLALLGENDVNAAYQIKATAIRYKLTEEELAGLRVYRVGKPIQEAYQQILGEIRARSLGPFGFVSIDTSAAYFGGSDENNNSEARLHAAHMRKFTSEQFGKPTVLVNCHPAKAADSRNLMPRGGGAFVNEVDNNLTLWNEDGIVELAYSKLRMSPFEPISFLLDDQEIQFSDNTSRTIKVAKWLTETERANLARVSMSDREMLMNVLRRGEPLSLSKIAEACGWITDSGVPNKSKVRRALASAERDGEARNVGGVWRVRA